MCLPLPLILRYGCGSSSSLACRAENGGRLSHLALPDATPWGWCTAWRLNESPWQPHDPGVFPWTQLPFQIVGPIPSWGAQHCLLDWSSEDLGGWYWNLHRWRYAKLLQHNQNTVYGTFTHSLTHIHTSTYTSARSLTCTLTRAQTQFLWCFSLFFSCSHTGSSDYSTYIVQTLDFHLGHNTMVTKPCGALESPMATITKVTRRRHENPPHGVATVKEWFNYVTAMRNEGRKPS